jgi:sec-independent protein translocase protein TatB
LDISGWEFLTLGVLAVILFGPDRLPKFAADAAKFLKMMRGYMHNARDDLTRELGPEISDVKLSDLTPRGLLRKTLGDDDPFRDLRSDMDLRSEMETLRNPMAPVADPPRPVPVQVPLGVGEVPPFDPETT